MLRALRRRILARARFALGIVEPRHDFAALSARVADLERAVVALGGGPTSSIDLESRLHEASRRRWRDTEPVHDLTWGQALTGDAFVERMAAYGAFGPDRRLLEMGPGYGRLLSSIRSFGTHRAPFASYLGIDISEKNVTHLREKFGAPDVAYVHSDAESVRLDQPFDVFFSSLTLKHLFPTFERVLVNLAAQAGESALFVFDVLEGDGAYFESDGSTYIRYYSREEILGILRRAGLTLVAFDTVEHSPQFRRLLVVARRNN